MAFALTVYLTTNARIITTMNNYATPETFKPGERWLVYLFDFGQTCALEVYCLEWSPSKKFVKIEFAQHGTERWEHNPITLVERLPDESSVNNEPN